MNLSKPIPKNEVRNTIIGMIVLIILLTGFFYGRDYYRDKQGVRYTIAYIYDVGSMSSRGSTKYFEYLVNGKIYKSFIKGNIKINKNNLIYISYLITDPSSRLVIESVKVPDCLQYSDAPANGWSKLPNENICDSLGK